MIRVFLLRLIRRVTGLPIKFLFSQGGEDAIAEYYLPKTTTGVYVDVGCNDPARYSNTFALYLRGWRGILIDANKDLVDRCRKVRAGDICICAAVSDEVQEVTFHHAEAGLMSTMDAAQFEQVKDLDVFQNGRSESLTTRTLNSILEEHPTGEIDLLSIDVEGHDLQVLKSIDLDRYNPKLIIAEIHDFSPEDEVVKYLAGQGYKCVAYAVMSAYFQRV